MNTNRRHWLKQSAVLFSALGFSTTDLFAIPGPLPAENGNAVLLNSNENAFGPSPSARKAILDHYLQSNRYPDDLVQPLIQRIAKQWSVKEENILLGAGSSEIIGLSLIAGKPSQPHCIVADPAYSVWQNQAKALGYEFTKVPLTKERKLDLEQMSVAARNKPGSFIYICNPNNPTGTHVDPTLIREFAKTLAADHFVFIDEAYTEYANLLSLADFAISIENVVVAKTFSKVYGLAGARLGYAIAHPATIKRLSALQAWPNANVSTTTAAAGMAALDDQDFVNNCKVKTEQARELCYTAFRELGLVYIPSSANFILFNIDKIKGDFSKQMMEKNIYVQHREHFGGRWCRVTMGTGDEMKLFISALNEITG